MKKEQIEYTRKLLVEIQSKTGLSQKKIAVLIKLKEPELSKAKNPKLNSHGELSSERRQEIIKLLENIKSENGEFASRSEVAKSTNSENVDHSEYKSGDITESIVLAPNELRNSLVLGCVLSGVVAVLFVILFKDQMGYENMSQSDFNELIPFSFLSFVIVGAYIGWMSSFTLRRVHKDNRNRLYFYFTSMVFLVSFIFAGIKSRDSYLLCKFTDQPCNGLLGEPNFEILGIASALAICGYGLVRVLDRSKFHSWYEILSYSVFYSVIGTCAFALFDQLHNIAVHMDWVVDKGHWINSAIFKYSFSHPERVPAIWIQIFLSLLITLSIIKNRLSENQNALPTGLKMEP